MRGTTVLLALTALLISAPAALASSLSANVVKFPSYARVTSSFQIAAPECVQDEYGFYPFECQEGDLLFRVDRKRGTAWRSVYRDSTLIFADSETLAGKDTTRLWYFMFRGHSYSKRVCSRFRIRVTLVDSFPSTANPTRIRFWRACYGG